MAESRLTLIQPAQLLGVTLRTSPTAALTLGPALPASSALLLSLAPVLRGEKGDPGTDGADGASTADAVAFTPAGGLSSTNVQAALQELDGEKLNLTGGTLSGVLELRNGANAQVLRLYNTYTDASNYERGFLRWNGNYLELGAEAAGTGVARWLRLTGNTYVSADLTFAGSGDHYLGGASTGINLKYTWWNGVSNKPWLTLLDGGNVGIGTSVPAAKLHIAGNMLMANTNLGVMSAKAATLRVDEGYDSFRFGVPGSWSLDLNVLETNGVGFNFCDSTSGPAVPLVSIKKSGRVGIGTQLPVSYLTVQSTDTNVLTSSLHAAVGQTADLMRFYRTDGVLMGGIGADGNLLLSVELASPGAILGISSSGGRDPNRLFQIEDGGGRMIFKGYNSIQFRVGVASPAGFAFRPSNNTLTNGKSYGIDLTMPHAQTGTAGSTGLLVNKTGTFDGSGAYLMMDLQQNGVPKMQVTDGGMLHLYNTYTDESNYERGCMKFEGNVLQLGTEALGTGSQRDVRIVASSNIYLSPANGVVYFGSSNISTNGNVNMAGSGTFDGTVRTKPRTVAALPTAETAGAGARSLVIDATTTTFLSIVAGGGANKVPVVSDGINWLIG